LKKINLDLDVVRTFATGIELGSFAKAADRLGRSTSAVSAQLKKLEEQTGAELFRKAGRGLALTEAGETMLAYARRLLELNDEAVIAVHGVELEGWVRLGLQEDFGETLLPDVLGRFARAPATRNCSTPSPAASSIWHLRGATDPVRPTASHLPTCRSAG
jgi:DNA-binding transcriptional LysR family regulator